MNTTDAHNQKIAKLTILKKWKQKAEHKKNCISLLNG
jgi:hypothetical protein